MDKQRGRKGGWSHTRSYENMRPNVRPLDGLLQIWYRLLPRDPQNAYPHLSHSYDLPQRVHTSKVYPLRSPNGSTIVVCGHELGLHFIWRGGRSFTEQEEPKHEKRKSNGASQDAIMIVDSSDEEPMKDAAFEDKPTFQDEDTEYDSSAPYDPIIQTLDLPLGVEVLDINFLRLPPDIHRSSLPRLISEKIVVAIACSDCSVRLLTVPLTPPSPESKSNEALRNGVSHLCSGKSHRREQMITLSSGTVHRSIPKGVSLSLTASLPEESEDVEMEGEEDDTNGLPLSRRTSRSRSRSRLRTDQTWDLLVASHSADLSGLLLIHRIPLTAEDLSISTEMHIPWRVQYLASPAVSVEFSSALYPSSRHSQLLVAEAKGSVRLLDCLPRSKAAQGSWLVSLHTDFEVSQDSVPRRKPILDARWVLGGKGIMVLQADGKWGIWNHEGHGPVAAEATSTTSNQSVRLLTAFALEGYVGASLKPKPLLKSLSTKNEIRSKLAPLTPSTRKMKQEALFTGPSIVADGPVRGGLSIAPIHNTTNNKPDDESILIWHGTTAMVIPSLYTHWQNKVRGSGNLFGSGAKGEPKTINNIHLGGELCNGINLIPSHQRAASVKDSSAQTEILVTGEKRFLIIAPPLTGPEEPATAYPETFSDAVDQQLLARGELDVNGMDRILAGMSNGHTPRRNSEAANRRNLLSI